MTTEGMWTRGHEEASSRASALIAPQDRYRRRISKYTFRLAPTATLKATTRWPDTSKPW